MKSSFFPIIAMLAATTAVAQINTGSDGSDGDFDPTTNTCIDMSYRPSGIYQYRSVNVRSGVTVTFEPNAENRPVVWLVQSNVTIEGTVDVSGVAATNNAAGRGGPGGFRGGSQLMPDGQGPGGGAGVTNKWSGGGGAYGTRGYEDWISGASGGVYGNEYLMPLFGGSGGGAALMETSHVGPGGGGGGAILIATAGRIRLNGSLMARGGYGFFTNWSGEGSVTSLMGGGGSGGGIRLVAGQLVGSGTCDAHGQQIGDDLWCGNGRVRFDTYVNDFAGTVHGVFSSGSQFVLGAWQADSQQLKIYSVGGVSVCNPPRGTLYTPDVFVPAMQSNPVPVIVLCSNVPISSAVSVTLTPANGAPLTAVGTNTGTVDASYATVLLNMPRGGGFLSAVVTTEN